MMMLRMTVTIDTIMIISLNKIALRLLQVVTAIKVKGMRFELIGAAITQYASKWLPGLQDGPSLPADDGWSQGAGLHMIIAGTGNKDDITGSQIREQRMVIESLISIIPPQKDCVSCSFLLRLLRLANMLKVIYNDL
jgi:NPH3 family